MVEGIAYCLPATPSVLSGNRISRCGIVRRNRGRAATASIVNGWGGVGVGRRSCAATALISNRVRRHCLRQLLYVAVNRIGEGHQCRWVFSILPDQIAKLLEQSNCAIDDRRLVLHRLRDALYRFMDVASHFSFLPFDDGQPLQDCCLRCFNAAKCRLRFAHRRYKRVERFV